MEFTIDPEQITNVLAIFSNPFYAVWYFFIHGGFLIVVYLILRALWTMWVGEVQGAYKASVPKVLLAIRVPRMTEQTPKAVENIFAHLTGTASGPGNWKEAYWEGKVPDTFSVEIVSRGGFIQYFIHAPVSFRDVIEASLYAQYPDAEVVEVADYATIAPQTYPDENIDTWGTEVSLAKAFPYPLKTYTAFEHSLDATFKDPLNSLFEFLGTVKNGEEVWIQIILQATDDSWVDTSASVVRKLTGVKEPAKKKGRIEKVAERGVNITNAFLDQLVPGGAPAAPKKPEKAEGSNIGNLSPGEKAVLEQIQLKAAKPGYWAKMRIAYIAPKAVFSKGRVATGVLGAFRQFGSPQLNGFKPYKYPKRFSDNFMKKSAAIRTQNKVFKAYVNRSMSGGKPYILNVEELATLWHFPMMDMKVPLIQRSEVKTAEPPFFLPMRSEEEDRQRRLSALPKQSLPSGKPKAFSEEEVPSNLPFA
ncbi:MAG: hypothetical protein AAB870_01035 [Patescibacteria group bacterium]